MNKWLGKKVTGSRNRCKRNLCALPVTDAEQLNGATAPYQQGCGQQAEPAQTTA